MTGHAENADTESRESSISNKMTDAEQPHIKEKKPKLTDAERRKRFVEMAKKVGASENLEDLDKALVKIASHSLRRSDKVSKNSKV
jgi:hypothetical protein